MLIPDDLDMELDEFVERFEMAHAEQPGTDVEKYMPSPQHPRYAQIGCELLRVHMELSAANGQLITAEEYRQRFPLICAQAAHFQAVQAEEERVRASSRGASIAVSASKSRQLSSAPTQRVASRVDMPKTGQTICDFQLLGELGRGAFSQVFLAQETSLSSRRVVLKISSKLLGEADLLSRLQHKNIVPVYSLHKYGQYHLICMPFLGTMTLADMQSAQPKSSSAISGKELISTLAAQASRTWKEGDSVANSSAAKSSVAGSSAASSSAASSSAASPDLPLVNDAESTSLERGLSSQLAVEVSRMSTTELALWIISELADGLAHAHQRGVLHRDIKPANILLSDDGLPMLLDFNLAASTKANDSSHQVVGGTLRYMSPEQLRSVQSQRSTLDARADVFSLGVVLYELLFRRAPFVDRTGSWQQVLEQMDQDRRSLPELALNWRAGLTPAVLSILRRALAYDASERYQSASEFRDDLRAHLQARPLRAAKDFSLRERIHKWNIRHPRLSSMTLAATLVATMLLAMTIWAIGRQSQWNRMQATQWLNQLQHMQNEVRGLLASDQAPTSAIERWLDRSTKFLATDSTVQLRHLGDADASQARLALGRLHFYRARGEIGMSDREPASRSQWLQSALSDLKQSQRLEPSELTASWSRYLESVCRSIGEPGHSSGHSSHDAKLVAATSSKPSNGELRVDADTLQRELNAAISVAHSEASNPWHWISIGEMQLTLGQIEPAAASFRLGHTLADKEALPAFFLGITEMRRRNFQAAEDWFSFAIAQDPACWEAWLNRAATRVELNRSNEAIRDIEAMGDHVNRYPRAWFVRETAESRLGKSDAAQNSRRQGLQLTPTDVVGWNARGQAKLRAKPVDAASALADFEQAINLDSQFRNSYENAAHVLSEYLGQPQAAVERLTEVLQIDPEYALAWSSRAVLVARLGQFSAARRDVEHALRLDRAPMICYQCASALALCEAADDKSETNELTSMHLLKETLRKDPALSRFMGKDQDLHALLNNPEFKELIKAASRLQ